MVRPSFRLPGFAARWLVALGFVLNLSLLTGAEPWVAKWIWHPGSDVHGYNQTIRATKTVKLKAAPRRATLRAVADSYYRLQINGDFVNDGPSRNWPVHYQYDELDVTPWLRPGANEVVFIARYYGVGDFHRVPQQAGLLAQLDVEFADGQTLAVGTDASWQTALASAWLPQTPKVSIQMEPAEWYNAALEGLDRSTKAAVLFEAEAGPWKGLAPRDVSLLTAHPVAFKAFLGAKVVRAEGRNFCLPAARLVNPGVVEANHTVSCACGMATVLELDRETKLSFPTEGMRMAVDGRRQERNEFTLGPGRHLVLAFAAEVTGHDKEKALRVSDAAVKLVNPLQPGHENPWVFVRFPEFAFATNDLRWIQFRDEDPRIAGIVRGYARESERLLGAVRDEASFRRELGARAEVRGSGDMFVLDPTWQCFQRRVVGEATGLVNRPAAAMHQLPQPTVVRPSPDGDVELLFDLGEQNVGYYDFVLTAEAGVVVDIFSLEYIAPDGRIQLPWGNRNGLRYLTRAGLNRFMSLKRRSGRYVFLTLRQQRTPVQLHSFRLVESTYPVEYQGSFACSDTRLDEIWRISTRTLKLCMEDTFTDCPLYEQTHWVGDARNESLLAYGVFGAEDLARRCIRITGESLDRYPFAGCQTPSGWDTLLPAWSFLWGISTWDYYWQTGDREQLRAVYPRVIQNLKGAERYVNERDLFAGAFWNLFDWTGADQGQKAVLHNNMFMVGAIDAALKASAALGETGDVAWLQQLRARLVRGVNRLWDPVKQAYPDSVRDDGSISPSTCQHTSFLALLYDITEPGQVEAAKRNLLEPPEKMVRIGSPFAMLYLYEAFEKLGLEDRIIEEIYRNYLPMLETGATTVWESFSSGTTGSGGFPTRSHCHAWSSAPTRFLNRIVLGVKTTEPGGRAVTVSPRLSGLTWARGTTATHAGPVEVSWKKTGDRLDVTLAAPAGVKAEFQRNATQEGLRVVVNGKPVD